MKEIKTEDITRIVEKFLQSSEESKMFILGYMAAKIIDKKSEQTS